MSSLQSRADKYAKTYNPAKSLAEVQLTHIQEAYRNGFKQGYECASIPPDTPKAVLHRIYAASLDVRDAVNRYHRSHLQNDLDELDRLVALLNRPIEAWLTRKESP